VKKAPLLLLCLYLIATVFIPASEGESPTMLAARSGPEGAILLKWNGAGEQFIIYRGDENLFTSAQEIARVNGTAFTDYPDINGNTYYYWVTVLSDGEESLPSPPATAVCDAGLPTVSLTSPSNGALITGALTIRGTAADAETGVSQVEVSVNGLWHLVQGTSSWQFSLSSPPEGEISIEARTQDSAGNIGYSELITVYCESVPPEIHSIQPETMESGTQTILHIYGDHFVEVPQVLVGAHSCEVTYISQQELTVSVPPLDAGIYDVTVINPDSQSETLSAAITAIKPNSPPVIHSISIQPQFVPNNGMTTAIITARITDGDSNLEKVTIDFSPLGGSLTEMKDDGVFPDHAAGDSLYSASTVVIKDVEEGAYTLEIEAMDSAGAHDGDGIVLNVVEDPPDNPPELKNYTVTPSTGTATTIFTYTVTYVDADNNVPTYMTITITGIGTFNMIESDPSDYTYMDGKNYYYQHSGLGTGTHSFTISTSDGTNPISVGATGPTVSGTNTPPDLLSQQVIPSSGTQSTNFRYTVTYKDADNDDPVSIDITITGVGTFAMSELDPSDQYFKDGKIYYYDYTAGLSVGTHSYTITADDGTDTTSVGGTGPTVTADANTPSVLSNPSVTPPCGNTSTVFIYQITYKDADNDDPVSIDITITGIGTFAMSELDPEDQNFKNGKFYYYVYSGGFPIGMQSYTITADDGTDTTSLGETGPEIPVGDCVPSPPPTSPSIGIYPVAGRSGVWVTVTGQGFQPDENNITVTFDSVAVPLTPLGSTLPGTASGTVKADASGNFSAKFKVPASRQGPKTVDAHGAATPASSVPNKTFTVIDPPIPPYHPPPSIQPPTDTISPNSIITYPQSSAKLKGTFVTVKGTASDNKRVVKVEVSIDNGTTWHTATGTETWSYRLRIPTDGIYTIRSRATDDEGNVELVGGRVTVIVDNTPPIVSIITKFSEIEPENSFDIKGIAMDNDLVRKVEISFDGGATWNIIEEIGEWTYSWNPADGAYTVQVRAYDDLQHVGYSDIVQVTIDTIPPDLYVTTPSGSMVTEDTFLITGTAYDVNGVEKVEVSVGDDPYFDAQGTDSWSYLWVVPSTPGEYPIYIRAWDTSGHATLQEITLIVEGEAETEIGITRLQLIILMGVIILCGVGASLVYYYFRG